MVKRARSGSEFFALLPVELCHELAHVPETGPRDRPLAELPGRLQQRSLASRAGSRRTRRAPRASRSGLRGIGIAGTASALGFLPFGAAGFYVGDSKLAATGLLWPFSILWMPGKAYNKAVDANNRDFESRLMGALEGSSSAP